MATHRVFVIWIHPLFRESVHLLLNHPDVEWVGATSDYAATKDAILSLQPDTVLIEAGGGHAQAEVEKVLKTTSWAVRIISLNLDNNKSIVYQRERRTIEQPEDLLHLIQDE